MSNSKTESLSLVSPGRWIATSRAWLSDWPVWWSELSYSQRLLPIGLIFSYWLALKTLGGFRGDHLTLGLAVLVLCYGGRAARSALAFAMPFFLTGMIYDSQRFYSDYLRGPVRVTEPYDFDKFFFGISTASGVLTPNEWWQLHTHPALDLLTGFAYLIFFAIFIVVSGYFYFFVAREGTADLRPEQVRTQSTRMVWSFLWLNLIGYSTYYWYAAAPPWYVAQYGLGPAQMDAQANSAGCARFDLILGTHFFSEMYGRAADVFGAIPSLHVAYPLLSLWFAFKFKRLRIFSIFFYLLMCFSAVYLNHHYILDIIWGSAYAIGTAVATEWVCEWNRRRREASHAASVL